MAPRSAARLVTAKKKVGRKKSTTTRKKAAPAGANFYCYRVTDMMTLHFTETRDEALKVQLDMAREGQEANLQKITVKSNADLAKVLREHTL